MLMVNYCRGDRCVAKARIHFGRGIRGVKATYFSFPSFLHIYAFNTFRPHYNLRFVRWLGPVICSFSAEWVDTVLSCLLGAGQGVHFWRKGIWNLEITFDAACMRMR